FACDIPPDPPEWIPRVTPEGMVPFEMAPWFEPRYAEYYRKGFDEVLRDYRYYSPYRIRNVVWSINSYAMQGVFHGRDECHRQLARLTGEFGQARVLRALRWRYSTTAERMARIGPAAGFVLSSIE